ncbi:MAG: DUF1566 domain-containing protein [Candidatus Cloacimonetes bacterium]|nr:DUF1566 domain-containing protein [Candidatus Cloacimonadota bacterium]
MKKYLIIILLVVTSFLMSEITYPVVDTGQNQNYNNQTEITAPEVGEAFYGQDAIYSGNQPSYSDNGDGTITDNVTGLMWQKTTDQDGNGEIDYQDKMSQSEAVANAANCTTGGYTDWRLPNIKEQYSLMDFRGIDPSGYEGSSTDDLVPFIDTDYFEFGYGDISADERIIDSQYATSTLYIGTTMNGNETMFGVNFADGRIKGYPTGPMPGQQEGKQFYVLYVRGNADYGINDLTDNGDGTITDNATGLMWTQADSGEGMLWEDALAYAEAAETAGYSDWRLPNVKELQSIIDYTEAPSVTGNPAIDQVFNCTAITSEAGTEDYPFYWTGTTHASWLEDQSGTYASYVCFGTAYGYMFGQWIDVHGAGAQRSDPKTGNPDDWPEGHGPQGDAIRIYNYVRLVRDAPQTSTDSDLPETGSIQLKQNYPNPFNPSTRLDFYLPSSEYVNLSIFNIRGQKIITLINEILSEGEHTLVWDGVNTQREKVSGGIYFYTLRTAGERITRKMVMIL